MRIRIIPDRLFARLWNEAEKSTDKSDYLRKYTLAGSPDYIDFSKKYHLEYEEGIFLLSEIFEKSKLTFKEILQLADKKKADVSNTFCIPIRTVEEWYSGKNKCASYIRLAILKQYHLISLGKYIRTEAEEEYKNTVPAVYKKKASALSENMYHAVSQQTQDDTEEDDLQNIDDFLLSMKKKRESFSMVSDKETQSILQKTSFIDDILKSKKRTEK